MIFIEVALTRGMSDRVQPLLDPDSAVNEAEAVSSNPHFLDAVSDSRLSKVAGRERRGAGQVGR